MSFDQALFDSMLAAGESRTIAEICASRKSPGLNNTERAFWEGKITNHGLGRTVFADAYIRRARAAGIDINGKIYSSSLADARGPEDPRAWVAGVDDVKAVAKDRNLTLTGSVRHEAIDDAPPGEPIPLAEDLIENEMRDMIAADPSKALMDRGELRHEIIERCSPEKALA